MAARLLLILTLRLGLVFVAVQASSIATTCESCARPTDAYGSLFYVITSFHALHVVAGLLMLIFVACLPSLEPPRLAAPAAAQRRALLALRRRGLGVRRRPPLPPAPLVRCHGEQTSARASARGLDPGRAAALVWMAQGAAGLVRHRARLPGAPRRRSSLGVARARRHRAHRRRRWPARSARWSGRPRPCGTPRVPDGKRARPRSLGHDRAESLRGAGWAWWSA